MTQTTLEPGYYRVDEKQPERPPCPSCGRVTGNQPFVGQAVRIVRTVGWRCTFCLADMPVPPGWYTGMVAFQRADGEWADSEPGSAATVTAQGLSPLPASPRPGEGA